MVRRHIHCNTTRSGELGQTALGSGGTTEVLHTGEDLEHGREPGLADTYSQAFMRSEPEVCVCIHITVEADLFGLFEDGRILAGRNLSYIHISIFCPGFTSQLEGSLTKLHTICSPSFRVIFSPLSSMVVSFVASRGNATDDCSRAPSMKLHIISTQHMVIFKKK